MNPDEHAESSERLERSTPDGDAPSTLQSTPSPRRISAQEWEAIEKADPVLAFARRVNTAATSSEIWNSNYALAVYNEFCSEYQKYVVGRFGEVIIEMQP